MTLTAFYSSLSSTVTFRTVLFYTFYDSSHKLSPLSLSLPAIPICFSFDYPCCPSIVSHKIYPIHIVLLASTDERGKGDLTRARNFHGDRYANWTTKKNLGSGWFKNFQYSFPPSFKSFNSSLICSKYCPYSYINYTTINNTTITHHTKLLVIFRSWD